MEKLMIFDLDGVLVDTSDSYDKAVIETVKHFLPMLHAQPFDNKKEAGQRAGQVTYSMLHDIRAEGGYNDDWKLTKEILRRNGLNIVESKIISRFQEFYLGKQMNGFIRDEKWLLDKEKLKELSSKFSLAIFTGRPFEEAKFLLENNNVLNYFDMTIARENVINLKPDPEGITFLLEKLTPVESWYVGDTIDDAKAATRAEVPFIGVIPPKHPDKEGHSKMLIKNGAIECLEDINDIIKVVL